MACQAETGRSPSLAALTLATAGVAVQGRRQPHDEAQKITVTALQSQAVTLTQAYVCQIHSHHRVEIRAPEAGYLEAIPIRAGQTVKKGDVMFELLPIQTELNPRLQPRRHARHVRDRAPWAKCTLPSSKHLLTAWSNAYPTSRAALSRSSETLTILFDNSLMWVYFNVPEARYLEYKSADLDEHMDDLKIELMLANGEKFDQPGKLGAIGADFNSATGNVPFRADFPNPQRLLRHGQTGTRVDQPGAE